jgi:nucleoid-associated protein YgaU
MANNSQKGICFREVVGQKRIPFFTILFLIEISYLTSMMCLLSERGLIMVKKCHTKSVISLVLLSFFLFACEIKMPIAEMSEAKSALSEAKKYSADVSAKTEYDAAEKFLYDSQSLVRDEKTKEAAESAVKSRDKAKEALVKALPLYAQAAMNTAKTDITSLKSMYAAEFAPQELAKAETLLSDSEKQYAVEQYIASYDKAVESSAASAEARMKVLSALPAIQGKIASLEAEYDELKSMNAEELAADNMKLLAADIKSAKDFVDEKKTKEASDAVNAASVRSADIRDTIMSVSTRKKIALAEDLIAKLSVSPEAVNNKTELEDAKDRILTANEYFDHKDYTVAAYYAEDALKIIDELNAKIAEAAVLKIPDAAKADETPVPPKEQTVENKIEQIKEAVREYVVQWRKKNTDCLWRIAEKVYNNAKLWPLIYSANRLQIKDPDLIYPGQKFVIPPVPVKEEEKPAAEEKKAEGDIAPPSADAVVPPPAVNKNAPAAEVK